VRRIIGSVVMCCLMLFVATPPVIADDGGWTLSGEKNGIKNYVKDISDSDYKAFKSTTIVDASMEVVGAVLRDVAAYPQWMGKVSEARVVRQYNPNDMDIYLLMNFPFPTTDRDAVASAKTTIDKEVGGTITTSTLIDDPGIPPQDGLVRLPRLFQEFRVTYKEYGKTEVSHALHIEIGGNLPVSMVNIVAKTSPTKTLDNLRHFVKTEKYQSADPFSAVNLETTQALIRCILGKYITDPKIMNMVIIDKEIMTLAMVGGHAEAGVQKTVMGVVKKYVKTPAYVQRIKQTDNYELLARLSTDEALLNKLAQDTELVDLVLETGGMTDEVLNMLLAKLKAM